MDLVKLERTITALSALSQRKTPWRVFQLPPEVRSVVLELDAAGLVKFCRSGGNCLEFFSVTKCRGQGARGNVDIVLAENSDYQVELSLEARRILPTLLKLADAEQVLPRPETLMDIALAGLTA